MPKKKPGRPKGKTPPLKATSIKFEEEMKAAIQRHAAKQRRTMADQIRKWIDDGLERDTDKEKAS